MTTDEVEVALFGSRPLRHLAVVDAVGVDNDLGDRRLPEDLGKPLGRHGAGADHVGQHCARTNRGQLIQIVSKKSKESG